MHPSLFFHPGALLSQSELSSARLDGLLIEVGEGYMPPDVPEDSPARIRSLAPILAPGYAASGPTAAWIHGVGDSPPTCHHVQRVSVNRSRVRPLRNVVVHERRLDDDDIEIIAGTPVTTRLRTLIDLVFSAGRDPESATWMRRFARADPGLVPLVRDVIDARRRMPGRRGALAALASLETASLETASLETASLETKQERPQDEVTR